MNKKNRIFILILGVLALILLVTMTVKLFDSKGFNAVAFGHSDDGYKLRLPSILVLLVFVFVIVLSVFSIKDIVFLEKPAAKLIAKYLITVILLAVCETCLLIDCVWMSLILSSSFQYYAVKEPFVHKFILQLFVLHVLIFIVCSILSFAVIKFQSRKRRQ